MKDVNLINENFDRDTDYWNDYYKRKQAPETPSLFAEFVLDRIKTAEKTHLFELGCGNGRDSVYFANNSVDVTAVDASKDSIDLLNKEYRMRNLTFICGDFVKQMEIEPESKYDCIYSRFSLHAINLEQEMKLLKLVFDKIKPGGLFFIEVRGVNDDIFGKGVCISEREYIYEGHYRRFEKIEELTERMENIGFHMNLVSESRGYAPYMGEDPLIIRIEATK